MLKTLIQIIKKIQTQKQNIKDKINISHYLNTNIKDFQREIK